MAGKRQHYLPRFLQRGFLSRKRKREELAFVFYSNGKHYEHSIKQIAVESRFYEIDEMTADDVVTDLEGCYAGIVDRIRKSGKIQSDDLNKLVEFIDHLVLRTKNSRSLLGGSTGYLVDKVEKSVVTTDFITNLLKSGSFQDRVIEKVIASILKEKPESSPEVLRELIRDKIAQDNAEMTRYAVEQARIVGPQFFSSVRGKLKNEIVKTQINFLRSNEHTSEKFKKYMELKWSVKEYELGDLILGDIGVVGINMHGDVIPPLFESNFYKLIFPISSNLLVIGSVDDSSLDLTKNEVNTLLSSMSIYLFVASNMSSDISRLSKLIGCRSCEFYKETIDSIVRDRFGIQR
ncbi:DUF4238 domain-containing protein [Desulfolutivibrio sp.]|uniref:DUF4238 domain-containing protein n=1 Tax=Desulfolutivibrio sp. TaxID=2773296 RepID=UPI002F9621EA